jgi:hypothetical protein
MLVAWMAFSPAMTVILLPLFLKNRIDRGASLGRTKGKVIAAVKRAFCEYR